MVTINDRGYYQVMFGFGSTITANRTFVLRVDGANLSGQFAVENNSATGVNPGLVHSGGFIINLTGTPPHTLSIRNLAGAASVNDVRGAGGIAPAGPAVWMTIIKLLQP